MKDKTLSDIQCKALQPDMAVYNVFSFTWDFKVLKGDFKGGSAINNI